MIRRIELVNFMSHANTVIQPAEGLTVLVGPNNCGKSAVVAALQILCHNENSTYVTRHNEKECRVTIETDDGHVVEWRRKNSPTYTVDGQPFDRLGRSGVPEGLHDILRLPKVTAEGNQEFDVHFGEQKSPVFLLDKPGSHAAQFFASSSDAASLVEMQKRHQQKMMDARKERTQLTAQFDKLASDLVILAATDSIGEGVQQVEAQFDQLQQSAVGVERLTGELSELHRAAAAANHLESESIALSPLSVPPLMVDPAPLSDLIDQIHRTRQELAAQSARAELLELLGPSPDVTEERSFAQLLDQMNAEESSLSRAASDCRVMGDLSPAPVLHDTRELLFAIDDLQSHQKNLSGIDARLAVLTAVNPAPPLADATALALDVKHLAQVASDLRHLERTSDCLAGLPIAPTLADPSELTQSYRYMTDARHVVDSHTQDAAELEKAQLAAFQDLREFVARERICHVCGAPLDAERLIVLVGSSGEGHSHA